MFEELILEYETLVADMNEGIGGRILDKIVPGRVRKRKHRDAMARSAAVAKGQDDKAAAGRAASQARIDAKVAKQYSAERRSKSNVKANMAASKAVRDKEYAARNSPEAKARSWDTQRAQRVRDNAGSGKRPHGDWVPTKDLPYEKNPHRK